MADEQKSDWTPLIYGGIAVAGLIILYPILKGLGGVSKGLGDIVSAAGGFLSDTLGGIESIGHDLNPTNWFGSDPWSGPNCAGVFTLSDGTSWTPLLHVNRGGCDQDWSSKNWVTSKTPGARYFTVDQLAKAKIPTKSRIGRDDPTPSAGEWAIPFIY